MFLQELKDDNSLLLEAKEKIEEHSAQLQRRTDGLVQDLVKQQSRVDELKQVRVHFDGHNAHKVLLQLRFWCSVQIGNEHNMTQSNSCCTSACVCVFTIHYSKNRHPHFIAVINQFAS